MKSVNISWIHPYFRHRPRSVCELNEQLQNAVPIVHSWKCKRASDASSRRLFTILFTWKDSWNIYTLFIQVDYLRGMFQVAILIQCMQSFKHERRHGKIKWMRHQSNRNKNPSCLSTKGTFIYLFLRIQIFKFPFQLCWLCSLSFRATFTLVGFRAVDCALSLSFFLLPFRGACDLILLNARNSNVSIFFRCAIVSYFITLCIVLCASVKWSFSHLLHKNFNGLDFDHTPTVSIARMLCIVLCRFAVC